MNRTISYRLPRAELVVSGTVRRILDSVTDSTPLGRQPASLVTHAITVRHVADEQLSVELPGGWIKTYKGAFTFNPDGRLTSASAESTGQAGTVLSSAATLAGTALGLRAGRAGVALGAPADPVEDLYLKEHPDVLGRRLRVLELLAKTRAAQLALADDLPDDAATSRARWDLLEQIHQSLRADLAVLDAHLAAWRDSTIHTVDESFEFAVPLAQVEIPDGEPSNEKSPTAPTTLAELWNRHGIGVTASWAEERRAAVKPAPKENQLVTRTPDLLTLSVVKWTQGERVVTSTSRHLVMDEKSALVYHTLEKSLFGRRSVGLTFDADGALTGLTMEGSAALAEAVSAAGRLPAAVVAGLGSANSGVSGLATARRAALEAELAQVKQEVELEQQRITQAGLHATATDAARLERLKQRRSLLETEAALAKADPRALTATDRPL